MYSSGGRLRADSKNCIVHSNAVIWASYLELQPNKSFVAMVQPVYEVVVGAAAAQKSFDPGCCCFFKGIQYY